MNSDFSILMFMYILISLLTLGALLKKFNISIFTFTKLFYIVMFFITPAIFLYRLNHDMELYYWGDMLIETPSYIKYGILVLSLIGYFILIISYNLQFSFFLKNNKHERQKLEVVNENKDVKASLDKKIEITAFILTILGWICLYLWTKAYGNIFGIFKYASRIRAGVVEISNSYTFLKWFCQFLLISSLLYFSKIIDGTIPFTKKIPFLILFIFSFFGSFIYMVAHDGRNVIMSFFIAIFLNILHNKTQSKKSRTVSIIFIFCLGIISILLFENLDNISYAIRNNSDFSFNNINIFDLLVKEFGCVYMNINNTLYRFVSNNTSFQLLNQIISIFFVFIPNRFKPAYVINLYSYNSHFYPSYHGTIPPDILSASLYLLGFIGLLIVPFICGRLIKKLDLWFQKNENVFYRQIYYLLVTMLSLRICGYLDFSYVLFNFLYMLIGILIYKIVCIFE